MVIQVGAWIRGPSKIHDDGSGELPFAVSAKPDETWLSIFEKQVEAAGLRAAIGEAADAPVVWIRVVPGELQAAFNRLRDVIDSTNERAVDAVRAEREAKQVSLARRQELQAWLTQEASSLDYARAHWQYPETPKVRTR